MAQNSTIPECNPHAEKYNTIPKCLSHAGKYHTMTESVSHAEKYITKVHNTRARSTREKNEYNTILKLKHTRENMEQDSATLTTT